ncbi:hypothetical protein C7435_2904 [Maricaulis maris]|uniref:Uncharacterized protein n=1 Tax=Maricaulis maris TaxID=74318 RepID=A0A495D0Y0_9PROT|nr:hypothetical protein C7435_2904 [Maricaulis maris]
MIFPPHPVGRCHAPRGRGGGVTPQAAWTSPRFAQPHRPDAPASAHFPALRGRKGQSALLAAGARCPAGVPGKVRFPTAEPSLASIHTSLVGKQAASRQGMNDGVSARAPHLNPTLHFSGTRPGAIRDLRETYRLPDRFVGPGSTPGKNQVERQQGEASLKPADRSLPAASAPGQALCGPTAPPSQNGAPARRHCLHGRARPR